MSIFAETANVLYCLSSADQGKQLSVFCFHLQQINGLFFLRLKQTEVAFPLVPFSGLNSVNMEAWTWTYTWRQGEKGKRIHQMENRSPDDFPYLFTICSSWKRKFVAGPFVDEETKRSYPFANGLNGLNGLQ